MPIPETEAAVLRGSAESGDEGAKALLAKLGDQVQPVKPASDQENKSGPSEPEKKEIPEQKVETNRERNGNDHRPSKLDTIRELRAEKRQLKAVLDEMNRKHSSYEEQMRTLTEQLNSLKTGKSEPVAEEDDLAKLLSKPQDYLSAREKRLVQEMEKRIEAKLAEFPKTLNKQNQASEAFNVLKGMKNFNLATDEDELLDMMEENGLDELAKINPMKAAYLTKTLWEGRNNLPPEKVEDKRAAASGQVGAGKPEMKPVTLESLNERTGELLKQGRLADPKELQTVMAEIDRLLKAQH